MARTQGPVSLGSLLAKKFSLFRACPVCFDFFEIRFTLFCDVLVASSARLSYREVLCRQSVDCVFTSSENRSYCSKRKSFSYWRQTLGVLTDERDFEIGRTKSFHEQRERLVVWTTNELRMALIIRSCRWFTENLDADSSWRAFNEGGIEVFQLGSFKLKVSSLKTDGMLRTEASCNTIRV